MEKIKQVIAKMDNDEIRSELAELTGEVADGVADGIEAAMIVQEAQSRRLDLSAHADVAELAKSYSYLGPRVRSLPRTIKLSDGYVGIQWDEIGKMTAGSRHMKCRDSVARALDSVGIPSKTGDPAPDQLPLYDLALVLNSDWVLSDEDRNDSMVPPKAAQEAAKRGLELRARFGRGGTAVGVARARDLSNGRPMTAETVARMRSFFARHGAQVDRRDDGWGSSENPSAGYIAWLLWGGDPGRDWANRNKPAEKGCATRLAKSADEQQVIYYLVSEPDTVDAHGHQISATEIRRALHSYMNGKREVRLEHDKEITGRAIVVEGFVAPMDLSEFHGEKLAEPVRAGSSIVAIHYPDEALWDRLRDEDHGISWGGYARKETAP